MCTGWGATLYTMLTAEIPFEDMNVIELITAHEDATATIPDPRRRQPEIPAPVVRLLAGMLGRKPEDRHADWTEVIEDIDRVLAGANPARVPRGARSVLGR